MCIILTFTKDESKFNMLCNVPIWGAKILNMREDQCG